MPEPVRLVIWDLDETFWRGTLTEGGIDYDQSCHDIVVALARRGIMSSICSKNDLESVRAVLIEKGIWDYFIFPSVDWTAKGPRIAGIIEAVQLRSASILFVDDNAHNRSEAVELNPGLRAADESCVREMLANPLFAGKDDAGLKRLKDYKHLEEKSRVRLDSKGDNKAFLFKSNIQVDILYNLDDHLDRAVELINRTNQLNFTKRRLPAEPVAAKRALLEELDGEFTRRAGLVSARDRFGDYGIVGFWAIEGHGFRGAHALHFCFSCRTFGMGVEQYVYERLGRPDLRIVGDVGSALDFDPAWINQSGGDAAGAREFSPLVGAKVLLRGGCEMEVLAHFFAFEAGAVHTEFLFVNGPRMYWLNHVANFPYADAGSRRDAEIAGLGFEPAAFASWLSEEGRHDLAVLNFSADAMVPVYRSRATRRLFSTLIWGLNTYLTAETDENVERFARDNGMPADHAAALQQLVAAIREGFDAVALSDDEWAALYRGVLSQAAPGSLVVMVLALETIPQKDGSAQKLDGVARINAIRREVIAEYPNVVAVEMDSLVRAHDDLLHDSTQHFSRDVNYQLFQRIGAEYAGWRKRISRH